MLETLKKYKISYICYSQLKFNLELEKKNELSVVIPVYGCTEAIIELCDRLIVVINDLKISDYKIILVDDDCPYNSWKVIDKLAKNNSNIQGIKLAKNFGQHKAITAGINYSKSDWVVVMDCDLQDRPEEIKKLHKKAKEGFDVVFGRRVQRKDKLFKKLTSKLFYKIYNYFTDVHFDSSISNFSIISRKVVKEFKNFNEQNIDYSNFIIWLGFNKTDVDIIHDSRKYGESSYNLRKLIKFGISNILSESNKPLRISISFGFVLAISSLLYSFYLIYNFIFNEIPVPGWTSVMVSIYFIGGLLFANIGVLGLYIGNIYNETKNRPKYVIEKKINFEE